MAQHARIKRTPPLDGARRRWWQNRLLQLLAAFVLLCGVASMLLAWIIDRMVVDVIMGYRHFKKSMIE